MGFRIVEKCYWFKYSRLLVLVTDMTWTVVRKPAVSCWEFTVDLSKI